MGYTAYDFIDSVFDTLTRYGAITPEQQRQEGLNESVTMQADLACMSIATLAQRATLSEAALDALIGVLATGKRDADQIKAMLLPVGGHGGIGHEMPVPSTGDAPAWTDEDSAVAHAQGWGLFRASRDGESVLTIERCDEANVFEDDVHAFEFVKGQAAAGCVVAVRALMLDGEDE